MFVEIIIFNFLVTIKPKNTMKKFIAILFLFVNYFGYSQIKVIETVPIEKVGRIGANGTNDIYILKEGNEYKIFFKNTEPTDMNSSRSFNFKDLTGDFESLYTIISDGFNATPLLDIKLELPNDFVWLHYTKNLQKAVTLQFMTNNKATSVSGISDSMTRADINSLFGEK
jgi:hypothetical protein